MQIEETNIEMLHCAPNARSGRLKAMLVSISAFALLGVAIYLQPTSGGVGTHEQLGLPQCGWITAANVPCPTCGMTTAWSHTVRGELPSAFLAQPMGMLLALSTVLVAFGALIHAVTGRTCNALLYRFAPSKVIIVIAVLALTSWGFKILIHKDIL